MTERTHLDEIRDRDAAWARHDHRLTNASQACHDRRTLLALVRHIGRKPIVPYVHLNGTSREALLDQLREAKTAVEAARDAVGSAGPHGRDYYVISATAFDQAQRDHQSRMERLTSVLEELTEMYIDVYRDKPERS